MNASTPADPRPTLYRDPSFWGMSVTQFLGAFNDNLFKQIILLLSIKVLADGTTEDQQGLATIVFSAPFLLVTGFAGYLADRFPKRTIIVLSKVGEIVVMALGGLAFIYYIELDSLAMLLVVLFFMGAQSGFFGPAKYGILPEMLRDDDLPRANGFILMTTFVSIILGTVVAGLLLDYFPARPWIGSIACIAIAIVGTISSLWVRRVPASNPELELEASSFAVPPDMIALLRADKPLQAALWVSSLFWLLAAMVPLAINTLGKAELLVGDKNTSLMNGVVSIGIAVGCVLGGLVSKGKVDFRLLRVGAIGMVLTLAVMGLPADGDAGALMGDDGELTRLPGLGESAQLLGYRGSLATLLVLGAFTGLFAVPLQVFMQSRPPEGKKGRMIAVMNQANWLGIAISGALYWMFNQVINLFDWHPAAMFYFIAALVLPIAVFYHPKNEDLSHA